MILTILQLLKIVTIAKPNLEYYKEIFKNINSKPEESIMVGNNALEDMIVSKLGVRTFLITDNLENPEKIDINKFENETLMI